MSAATDRLLRALTSPRSPELADFDPQREALQVCEEARAAYYAPGGSALARAERVVALLDQRAAACFDRLADATGIRSHQKIWGNLRVHLPFEAGHGFCVEDLERKLCDPDLRTVCSVIAHAFAKLRAPELRSLEPRGLQLYGFATLLEACADQISGTEILPDEYRLDPRAVPPALSTGSDFREIMSPLLRSLWRRERGEFDEQHLVCTLLTAPEPVRRFLYNNEGALLVLSTGFLLRAADAKAPQKADFVLYELADCLAAYQITLEDPRLLGGYYGERRRAMRALDMMEAAGGSIDDLTRALAYKHGELYEEPTYGIWSLDEEYQPREARESYRDSTAQALLKPIVEFAQQL